MDTTVCEGDSTIFTCVVFFPSGTFPSNPGWLRDGTIVGMMRHTVTGNLTGGAVTPISVSSTLTVSNVTVVDDDGASYVCGSGSSISTSATLNVAGRCHTFIMTL